ncbi:hypothetical protein BGY98DRAFT_1103709 [Russula aff. rugulosa BPL654]|nr:hypothetical protein BGY98DRAFT_1103709 [Russula aff. rugulosa BPL654]
MAKEKPPSMQQQLSSIADRILRADEEKKDNYVVNSFKPMYLYDAMKEKKQLKPFKQQDTEEFLSLYPNALKKKVSVRPA